MNITITWEAVIAICAAVGIAAGGLGWYVRSVIREEVGAWKAVTEFRLEELEGKPRRRVHAT